MTYQTKVFAGGKIVLPAQLRRELGISEGDHVLIERENGRAVITKRRQVLREIQAEFRKYAIPGVSIVDELIAERRSEAAREDEKRRRWLEARERGKTAT